MRLIRLVARIGLILCGIVMMTGTAGAEPYPAYQNLFVNDYSKILPDDAQSRIRDQLQTLKDSTGVEMTVITVPTRKDYDPSPSVEVFAKGLFNYWGVGGKDSNNGILMLVVTRDHETRIALGAGYDQGYDVMAQDIINNTILPAFRTGDFGGGIEQGVTETISKIAQRQLDRAGKQGTGDAPGAGIVPWLIGGVMAALAGIGIFGKRLRDVAATMQACPSCGKRELHIDHQIVTAATATATGVENVVRRCRSCDWSESRTVTTPAAVRDGPDGSFGGGRSSGGGATGRW